jgi:hypothetical protein
MATLTNINILKLIFLNMSLLAIKYITTYLSNKSLICISLNILNLKSIFKSFGKSFKIIYEGQNKAKIISILLLDNNNLLSISNDRTFKVVNMIDYQCTKTIQHNLTINSIIKLSDCNLAPAIIEMSID